VADQGAEVNIARQCQIAKYHELGFHSLQSQSELGLLRLGAKALGLKEATSATQALY
jgi:hypothetical protein